MSLQTLEKCREPYIKRNGLIFPCNTCEACRRNQIREWSIRGEHELMTTPGQKAMFITLSYSPKNLRIRAHKKMNQYDQRSTLMKHDEQLFKKRLRMWWSRNIDDKTKLRFILAGEYGPNTWRAHYHLICYGASREDIIKWLSCQDNYNKVKEMKAWKSDKDYIDRLFSNIWRLGHVDVSEKPFHEHAIQYTVGYCRKKLGNKYGGKKIYEENGRIRPYLQTSNGIGREWAIKNAHYWAETLKIARDGKFTSIPRYYIKLIYKLEGLNIKYDYKHPETGEIITKYKVLKDYSKEYTKKITLLRQEINEQLSKEYKMNNPTHKELQEEYDATAWAELKKSIKEQWEFWNLYKRDKNQAINFLTERHNDIIKRRNAKKARNLTITEQLNNLIEREEALIKAGAQGREKKLTNFKKKLYMHLKARDWNDNLAKRDVYGKRNEYEKNEEAFGEIAIIPNQYYTPEFDWEREAEINKYRSKKFWITFEKNAKRAFAEGKYSKEAIGHFAYIYSKNLDKRRKLQWYESTNLVMKLNRQLKKEEGQDLLKNATAER